MSGMKVSGKISTHYKSPLPSGSIAQVFTLDHKGQEYSYLENKYALEVGDDVTFEQYTAVMKNGSEFYRVVAGSMVAVKPNITLEPVKKTASPSPMDRYVALKAAANRSRGTNSTAEEDIAKAKKYAAYLATGD